MPLFGRTRIRGYVAVRKRLGAGVKLRTIATIAGLVIASTSTLASSVLLHRPTRAKVDVIVHTYAGEAEATTTSVYVNSSLTVILLEDTMGATALDGVKQDLLATYPAWHGRPLRIATVRADAIEITPTIQSRSRLASVLQEIEATASKSEPPLPDLLDTLASKSSEIGSHWSQALIVGDFPVLDSATIEYASGVLVRAFGEQRLRVVWLPLSGGGEAWRAAFESLGGSIVHGSISDAITALDTAGSFAQVDWRCPPPSGGILVGHSTISTGEGDTLLEAPEVAPAPGVTLPSIQSYSEMERKVAIVSALLSKPPISGADLSQAGQTLAGASVLNPIDPVVLQTEILFNEVKADYPTAVKLAQILVSTRPQDGYAYATLGHSLMLNSDLDQAEATLKQSEKLNGPVQRLTEDYAQISIARKDDRGALPYFAKALAADPRRQDLWFQQAQVAERVKDLSLAIHSLEQGLALGGIHVGETASLIRLYLAIRQDGKATALSTSLIASLPPDARVREYCADQLEQLKQFAPALSAWKRVLEVEPGSGHAYYRIAGLLLATGDTQAAEQAADEGLAKSPNNAELYIVKADILEKEGHGYSAREILQQGAAAVTDRALLSRLALDQDSYSGLAAAAYTRLAETVPSGSVDRVQILERGFAVSVRDGDEKSARTFATELKAGGHSESAGLIGKHEAPGSGTLVPGGTEALAYAAHMREGIPQERFLVEYARSLVTNICPFGTCGPTPYARAIVDYLQRVAALEALGRRDGNRVVVTLSLSDKGSRQNTERVLDLLGIKLHSTKGSVEVSRSEKKGETKKQETLSALAVDEGTLQEALQGGKSYELQIRDDRVPVLPSEDVWRKAFYPSDRSDGAFVGALLRNPQLAQLYVGLSSMDRRTIDTLLMGIDLHGLCNAYADVMYLYASAIGMEGTRPAVPGGPAAQPIWQALVGESIDQPPSFFRALLIADDGKLLAFFFALSQLDRPHQMFFTASQKRTTAFYHLFLSSKEMHLGPTGRTRDYSFTEFLRSIPLDSEGHVDFPGSAEVWMVAKGRSSNDEKTTKLLRKVAKTNAPEVEDEILVRLAQTHYNDKNARHTELDNFLALSRINAHRSVPLDEESALLLAQRFPDSGDAYAYFADLTGVDAKGFHSFFSAIDRIGSHSSLDANLQIGQLHSLLTWICLLRRRQLINDAEATKLFNQLCDRFAAADGGAAYTAASLDSASAILSNCKNGDGTSPDTHIESCLIGHLRPGYKREHQYERVLDVQKVPSLAQLFLIYDGASHLLGRNGGIPDISAATKAAENLPTVDPSKGTRLVGKEKGAVLRYDPAEVRKAAERMNSESGKGKPNRGNLQKDAEELLSELQPQVTLALAGPVYAYYLRPEDLLVSDDPLLLRKHRYYDSTLYFDHRIIQESSFNLQSDSGGTHFGGGFAQFSFVAGTAAGANWKVDNNIGTFAIGAQIGAIRSANWDRLRESDQRLVGLRIVAAREWVFRSATSQSDLQALSEETLGLLSLSRRATVLNGIQSRDWVAVWDSLTLSDLFALGGKYKAHMTSDAPGSPSLAQLRAATSDDSRLNLFASVPYHLFGCGHAHLVPVAPYEEYERRMMSFDIAERSAEFKLFLAFRADGLGIEPSALADIAEPLAEKAFGNARMTDDNDWRSLLAGYESITTVDLKRALEP